MENLILAIVLYVAIVAIANRPNRCTTTTEPVDYSDLKSDSQPVVIVEPLPIATFQMPKPAQTTANDLSALSIRDLKKMASSAKIKRYSTLTKAQLITALTA